MATEPKDPTATRIIWALMTIFFAAIGWYTLWRGGIELAGKSGRTTFVTGAYGVAVVVGAFGYAALGVLMFGRTFSIKPRGYTIALACLLVPPVVYYATRAMP